ncbi:MAG TPA: hypothetical protein VJR48_02390, partial [Ktedonobacterales bacterium]|nr:hypothetical protein [Ktedonobacterales bacterium]
MLPCTMVSPGGRAVAVGLGVLVAVGADVAVAGEVGVALADGEVGEGNVPVVGFVFAVFGVLVLAPGRMAVVAASAALVPPTSTAPNTAIPTLLLSMVIILGTIVPPSLTAFRQA